MRALLDLANVIIHETDGAILHWTTGCERLYGWSKQEATGQVVHDLLATTYPQPRDEIIAELRERGSWQGELEHRQERWIGGFDRKPVGGAAIGGRREISTVLQTNNDITGLKRAQN